jgi:hypothetical protein
MHPTPLPDLQGTDLRPTRQAQRDALALAARQARGAIPTAQPPIRKLPPLWHAACSQCWAQAAHDRDSAAQDRAALSSLHAPQPPKG